VVIGKGHLIVETSIGELIARAPGRYVKVRTPADVELLGLLGDAGARVRTVEDGSLAVEGMDAEAIAELAASRGIVLHELAVHAASLEEGYLELTHGSVEYRCHEPGPGLTDDQGARTGR
jgi:ABC-2 type transport system ATP-binding protein